MGVDRRKLVTWGRLRLPARAEEHSCSPSPLVGEGGATERSGGCSGRGVLTINNPLQSSDADASADSFPHKGGSGSVRESF